MKSIFQSRITQGLIVLVVMLAATVSFSHKAEAGSLTNVMVRLDRMSTTAPTGGVVCAKPATAATEGKVLVTFPTVGGTNFVLNATIGNWVTDTAPQYLPSGTTAWVGMGNTAATTVAGQVVTWPSGELVVGTTYCFHFSGTNTLTNGASGGSQVGSVDTQTGAAAAIDTGQYSVATINNDQVVITATVPPIFTFVLNGNSDTFVSNLSSASVVSTGGRTITIGTNAANGWIAWVKSANTGLVSAGASAIIATAGTVNNTATDIAGSTGYVLDADITSDSGTGTGTVSQAANFGSEYNGLNTDSGGTLSGDFQPIAASNGTTDGDVLTIIERAKVSAVQAAGNDYTDTLTVIGAGRF